MVRGTIPMHWPAELKLAPAFRKAHSLAVSSPATLPSCYVPLLALNLIIFVSILQ